MVSSAMAWTQAIFMASLMVVVVVVVVVVVAPTSRAPRKIKGKHKTLLTWLG